MNPTPPAPHASESAGWQSPLGAACLGAGIATGVCRYALLPLELTGNLAAILIGLAFGLAVAGVQLVRSSRARPGPAGLLAAALAGGGIASAAFLLLAPAPAPLSEVALQTHPLPGLKIHLPAGPASQDSVQAASGRLRFDSLWQRRGSLVLEWEPAERLTRVEAEAAWGSLRDQIEPAAELQIETLARPGLEGYRFTILTTKMALSGFQLQCPGDRRTFSLVAGFPGPQEQVRALLERILDSIVCLAPPEFDPTRSSLPAFALPEFGLVPGSLPAQLLTLDGEGLLIHHNRHGDLEGQMATNPQVIQALFRSLFAIDDAATRFQPARKLSGAPGSDRKWWPIDVDLGDEQIAMGFCVLDCPDSVSYLLLSMRPANALPTEWENRVLSAIACPGPDRPAAEPPVFDELARAACQKNDPRGCKQLAWQLQERKPSDPEAEVLLKKACELGDQTACAEFQQ